MEKLKNIKGQIVLILLLVMIVALAIGLSVIQRSLSDISTATKVEQSSRAFSAAEAGIEKALRGDESTLINFPENNSSATITVSPNLPQIPSAGIKQDGLEYPPLAKEDIAHVWLADYNSISNPPTQFYTENSIEVYWGDLVLNENVAIEITVIYYNQTLRRYVKQQQFFDADQNRTSNNGFSSVACGGVTTNTTTGPNRQFSCLKTVGLDSSLTPMILRARLLYNNLNHPLAVQTAVTSCSSGCYLPSQAQVFTSVGTSGDTQRKIQVFKIDNVVPFYFDYALFASGDIAK